MTAYFGSRQSTFTPPSSLRIVHFHPLGPSTLDQTREFKIDFYFSRYERLQITKSSSKEVHSTFSPRKYKTIEIWTTVWSWSFNGESNRKARHETNWQTASYRWLKYRGYNIGLYNFGFDWHTLECSIWFYVRPHKSIIFCLGLNHIRLQHFYMI